jgi:hypothetical protein
MCCLQPIFHFELLCTQQSNTLIILAHLNFLVWSTYMCVTCLVLHKLWTKFRNITHLILIFFSPTGVLALVCTHKHEIIPFHNTLMIILLIMYIYFSCLSLISLVLSNLFKSRLFTCYICFQFGFQYQLDFKLMHRTCMISDLNVLHIHGKIRR